MPNIGPLELGIILLVVLIIFGPKRLPSLGRQLGTGMREFKDSITAKHKDDDEDDDAAERQASLSATPAAPPTATAVANEPSDAATAESTAQKPASPQ